ncbi:MAG: response regulator [Paludibacteraceae bacterium]
MLTTMCDSNKKTSLILVDDHPLFLMGLHATLSEKYHIMGEAHSGDELFAQLKSGSPDIVLLDIIMPGMSGVEAACRLHAEYPDIKILVLSAETTEKILVDMLQAGIDGFVSKLASVDELCLAVETVKSGTQYFGKDIARIIYDIRVAENADDHIFTHREMDIIRLCAEGLSLKEIADTLNISARTVDTHKTNIFRKLGINNSVELVRYAIRHHIIQW